MKLIACSNCHTQYDVSTVVEKEITCRCGSAIENRTLEAVDALIHRCGACGAQVGAEAESCDYCGSEIVRDQRKLSLICPECYGRNADDARFCAICGVAFSPEPIETDAVEVPCPCCSCLMPVSSVAGMALNECPQCNGVWVPENRFNDLVGRACESARQGATGLKTSSAPRSSGGNPRDNRVVYRKCPVCDAHMQRANFQKRSGVIIDRCHTHGTWLDADELEQIAGFILKGGMEESAREYQMRAEINASRRRHASALARAERGGSISIGFERSEPLDLGTTVLSLLKRLLD